MTGSLIELLKAAGPFAFLNVALGALGLIVAVAALVLGKSGAGRVLGVVSLLIALGAFGLGIGGYFLGMTATNAALGNAPDDQKDMLLRMGTQESRGNLLVALVAAVLPLVAGLVSALRTRFIPGLALGALVGLGGAAVGAQWARPLPPGTPPVAEPEGLTLATSSSPRGLDVAALIALTPAGLWANGQRVNSLGEALAEPLVTERNRGTLPLLVDARVPFSSFIEVVEAAQRAQRNVQLVVRAPEGERRVIHLFNTTNEAREDDRPPLALRVHVTARAFHIGASGGSLPALPADAQALNDKLAEVKSAFPNEYTLRLSAEPSLPFAQLVAALDAVVTRDGKLLFPEVTVERFQPPPGKE